jgi:hypothetical protein
MEMLAKNLWLLLTIVIPGMTTYGTFRLLLVLYDCKLDKTAFDKVDSSGVLTTSLIVAIALIQQAIAIALEAGASFFCVHCHHVDRGYRLFFCERFRLAASGKLDDNATRIIGSVFTSLNMAIGQLIILWYFWYRGLPLKSVVMQIVLAMATASLIAMVFRLQSARSIIFGMEGEGDKSSTRLASVTSMPVAK